jgi:site-specific recombinase XerD
MTRRRPKGPPDPPDLAALLPSWERHLRAENKAPGTTSLYARGVRLYLAWLQEHGAPATLDRGLVQAFVAELLTQGRAATTASARLLALRLYARWLIEEGELPGPDPLAGIKPPKLDSKVVEVLTEAQLRDLIRACQGPSFRDRRDEALVRLLAETGIRAGEAVALQLGDVDLDAGAAVIRRGKGGKGRRVPFGSQTTRALDRYLRVRRGHRLAGDHALWLGDRGRTLQYEGLYRCLIWRAELAGIANFHPHVLRHTAASRWLAAGGSEGGLMSVAGWSKREMLDRYVASTRAELAAEEARRLGLGDL